MFSAPAFEGVRQRLQEVARSPRIQRLRQTVGATIQRFSRPSYRGSDQGLVSVGVIPGLPAGACILPREKLLFTRIDVGDIPPRQRREAVSLELEQHAPFETPRGWVLWQGSRACVWYWPLELEDELQTQLQARRQQETTGLAMPGTQPLSQPLMVPETALWPLLADGVYRWVEQPANSLYLLQFQHPRNGLHEKRYPGPISEQEATAWLQRHGAEVSGPLAPVDTVLPAGEPIAGVRAPWGESLSPQTSVLEQRVFPATAALLVFLILVYGVANVRAIWETERAQAERRALQTEVQDVMALRDRADELRVINQRLMEIRQPSQLAVAAHIAERLDLSDTALVRWQYRNGRLELSWRSEDEPPEATSLIRRLEALPAFRNVQAQINADIVETSLDITGAGLAAPETGETARQAARESNGESSGA